MTRTPDDPARRTLLLSAPAGAITAVEPSPGKPSDFRVNAQSGAPTAPGMPGHFIWSQALPYDDGRTWQGTWRMDWTRA